MNKHYYEQSDELKEKMDGRLVEKVWVGRFLMCLCSLKKLCRKFWVEIKNAMFVKDDIECWGQLLFKNVCQSPYEI